MDAHRSYSDEPEPRWQPYPGPDGGYDGERYRVPESRYTDEPSLYSEVSGDLARFGSRDGYPGAAHRRSGADLPTRPPADPAYPDESPFPEAPGFHTEPIDRSALRRPAGPAAPTSAPTSAPTLDPVAAPGAPTGALPGLAPAGPAGPAPGGWPAAAGGPPAHGPAVEPAGGAIYRTRRAGVAALLVTVAIVSELLLVRVPLTGEFGHPAQPSALLGGIFAMAGIPLVTMGLYGLMSGAAAAAGPAPGRAWLRTPLAYLPVGLALIIAGALAIR